VLIIIRIFVTFAIYKLEHKYLLIMSSFSMNMVETITVNKQAIVDLLKVKNEFDVIIESLELSNDKDFMNSYKKSKEQIKKREFVD